MNVDMETRVREHDWARTPLGPRERWPQSLRLAVGICLSSRFPMFVWWGPELVNIYNDAYAPILGRRHPDALGRPAQSVWHEIWPVVGPQAEAVMRRGEATWNERVLLVMERNGYTEDTWFTWSYSPIPDDAGGIGGVFCACVEETGHVLAERGRDRLERALRRSEEGLAQAARLAGFGVFDHDHVTGELYWSPVLEQIHEWPPGTPPDLDRMLATVLPEDRAAHAAAIRAAHDPAGAGDFRTEYRVVRGDGEVRWISAQAQSYFEGEGPARRLVRTIGAEIDVTERRRAEAALAQVSEERRLALDSARLGWWRLDLASGVLGWDERFREIFGFEGARSCLDDVVRVIVEADRPRVQAVIDRATAPGGTPPFTVEYRIVRPGGDVRWLRVSGQTRESRLVGTVEDVTDRKRAETEREQLLAQVAAQRDRTAEILESISDAFYAVDADFRFTYVNREAERLWGRRREALVGRHYWTEFPQAVGSESHRRHLEVMAGRRPARFETRSPVLGRWIEAAIYPERGGGLSCYFRDISDRKRAEAERDELLASERAARAEAERASRTKDEFLATLSHELRTPLSAILGWAQILSAHRDDPALVTEGIEVIDRNVRSQARIVEDLLDMSRVVSGKVRLEVTAVDVGAVVVAAVETVRHAAEARGVALDVSVDAAAPPVSGDRDRLQQVVWNLLSNAIKFTSRGGRVQVRLERKPPGVELAVRDTGEGIRPEFLPHVFDRFKQADASTTRRHGGLGLGLSIVKHLVELHGGTARAESAGPGTGATFVVALPAGEAGPDRGDDPEGPPVAADRAAPALGPAPTLRGLRVLVVDDEGDVRGLVRRLLEEREAEVLTAASATEALAAIGAFRPDVLVSDIGMPDHDGYELIKRVRALGPGAGDVPAVALTAYARAEDRRRAVLAGYQTHLAKPVEPFTLIAAVARLARREGSSAPPAG